MKKILCLFALMFAFSLISCGDSGSNDTNNPATPDNPKPNNSSEKFGITGISLSIGSKSAPAHIIMKDSPDEGAYVTWETWIENEDWTSDPQLGSYNAWDIKTYVSGTDNVTQIVGLAQTCICTDIDRETGTKNVYCAYYGTNTLYLAVRGTLHQPDGSTLTSEYRTAIPMAGDIRDYVDTEVMGQNASTFVDRLTLSLVYTVDDTLM